MMMIISITYPIAGPTFRTTLEFLHIPAPLRHYHRTSTLLGHISHLPSAISKNTTRTTTTGTENQDQYGIDVDAK
jgi:hypothetical protein